MTGALTRVRSAAMLLLVAAPLALAACAGSGYHYVKSSEDKTYFKVPENWHLYDEESVLGALEGALSKDEIDARRDTTWTSVFDADPDPSLNHVASRQPNYPVGRAIVQPLSPEVADERVAPVAAQPLLRGRLRARRRLRQRAGATSRSSSTVGSTGRTWWRP